MTQEAAGTDVRQWLASPPGQKLLQKIAFATRKRQDFGKYRVSVSGSVASDGSPDHDDPLIAELISELCVFIIEKADRLDPLVLCETANPEAYIYVSFINHLKEKARKRNMDAGRYLYKRATSIFSKAKPAIAVKRTKQSSAFSLRPDAENRSIPPLTDDDLAAIPFPVDQVQRLDFDAVNHKTALLTLGAHFWNTVFEMWGRIPVWIDVYDFIRWLQRHVTMPSLVSLEEAESLAGPVGDPADDSCFDPEKVKTWARLFANHLSQKEKPVFLMRHGQGMPLEKIAQALKYKGASGPSYHLENAEEKLRYFLRDLPWLTPEDMNSEAFTLFYETLMRVLKK
jgi:hypothetical protein